MVEEIAKSFTSWNSVLELHRANEYYARALGVYTRKVTCPRKIGREPIESFGEQTESG